MINRVARLSALMALALLPMLLIGGAVGQGVGVVTITGASANEGEPLKFWVGLSPALATDVVVELETAVDGRPDAVSATADSDFQPASGARVTIHAGSTGAWFTVATVEDGLYEGDETFTVRVGQVVEGIARVGAADRAVGTIIEDDAMPEVRLHQSASGVLVDNAQSVDDAELTLEGGSASEPADIVYRVYMSSPSGLDTTVPYSLSGTATADVDYTDPDVKQLVIPAGQLSGVISITTLPDTVGEDHETVVVTLGTPTNATVKSGAGEATGRIFDDDKATHIVLSVSPHSVPESVTTRMTYTLTASLGGGATADSPVLVESRVGGLLIVGGGHTAAHGADFGLRDAVEGKIGLDITIPAGQNSGSNTFSGTITHDTLDEFDEAIAFGHDVNRVANTGELWGAHNGYSFFYPRLTIVDDDGARAPSVSVANAAAVSEGNDPAVTTDMSFTVSLSAASGKDVTVWYSLGGTATAGLDYDSPPLSLTIAAGATTGIVTIPVRGDTIDEGASETVALTLLGAEHAELAASGATASGLITDDDSPPTLSVADASADEGSAVTFSVSLSQPSGSDVTFSWSTGDDASGAHPADAGDDYASVAARTVVIPAATRSVQVTVQTLEDDLDEHAETFKLILSSPVNAALAADPTAVGTINVDAADPQPTVTIADAAEVAEGDDPAVTSDMVFPVTLSEPSGKDVTVTFAVTSATASAGDDYVAPTSATLTIPAGQTSANIVVQIKGDTEDELHDILTVTLSNPVHATLGDPSTAEGMIRDNEGTSKPWVRLSIRERSIVEGEPITVQVRSKSVAKQDIDVNFYVWYAHDEYSLGRVERSAWFENPRGTGLQIATIPAGATGIDFIINTRADQANFNGYIAAAMLTPGLMSTKGYQNLGDPDGSIKPHMLDPDSLPYRTATKEQARVTVRDGADALSPLFTIKRAAPRVTHAGEPVTFVLYADAVTTADTVVSYEVVAAGGVVADAAQGIQQITVPRGARIDWVTIPTVNTGSGDDHTLSVRLARGAYTRKYYTTGYLIPTTVQEGNVKASVTVRDQTPPSRPTARIATSGDITEGGSATFTVSLDAAQTSRVTVFTRARVIGDYGYNAQFGAWSKAIRSGFSRGYTIEITIPPGQTEETLTVTTVDDAVAELDGAITLQIVELGSPSYTRSTASQATATVADNEPPPPPTVSVMAVDNVGEGEDASFTITADRAPTADLDVSVTISQNGDVSAATGPHTVTIAGGQTSAVLTVQTTDDEERESDGGLTATLVAQGAYLIAASRGAATVTVWDDDGMPPGYTPSSEFIQAVESKFGRVVKRHGATTPQGYAWGRVLIAFGRSPGHPLTHRGLKAMTLKPWLREVYQDSDWTMVAEEFKVFEAGHALRRSAPPPAIPEVSITAGKEVKEGSSASFAINVTPAPSAPLTITYTVSQVGDYRSTTGTSFTATVPMSGVLAVHVPTTDDQVDEAYGSITVTLVSGNGYGVSATQDAASVTIRDDDGLPLLSLTAVASVSEGGCTWIYGTLSHWPGGEDPFWIYATISQQGEFLAHGRSQLDDYTWNDTDFSWWICTADDQVDEPDGSFTVTLTPSSGYEVSSTHGSVTVNVLDNDDATAPTVDISSATGGTEGDTVSFTLTANPAPAADLTVSIAATTTGDFGYGTLPTSVTIPTTGSATVSIATTDDQVDEPDGSVTLTVNAGSEYTVGTASAKTVSVADDDPVVITPEINISAAMGGTEGDTVSFTLTANPAPTADLAVSVTATATGDFGYGALPTSVTIPSSGSATVSITTTDDEVDETDGSVTLTVNAGSDYTVGSTSMLTVTVADDDLPSQGLSNQSDYQAVVDLLIDVRDDPPNPAMRNNPAHVKKWNRVLAAIGYDSGESAMPDSEIHDNAAQWPDSPFKQASDYLRSQEQQQGQLQQQTPEVSVSAGGGVTEGGDAVFTLTANPAPAANLDVTVTVTEVGDYGATTGQRTVTVSTSGVVSFAVGTTDDQNDEPDGSLTATLNAGSDYTVSATQGAATVAVSDNDDAPSAGHTVDATVLANVQSYAAETHQGAAHVNRWKRVLVAFGEEVPGFTGAAMTSSEAQTYADRGWSRWDPVVEELTALEVADTDAPPRRWWSRSYRSQAAAGSPKAARPASPSAPARPRRRTWMSPSRSRRAATSAS